MRQKALLMEALKLLYLDRDKADFYNVTRAVYRLQRFAEANGFRLDDYANCEVRVR